MDPLEDYAKEVRDIHLSHAGVDETSYYPALNTLLSEVGSELRPKVKCIINLRNQGAGLPDGGFFTPDQLRGVDPNNVFEQIPARGALEVKGPREDVEAVADSRQALDYVARYGLVLITNLRDFLLVQRGEGDRNIFLERYTIATSADEFWDQVRHPRAMAEKHGERLTQYLKRVMLHEVELV